MTPYRDCSHIDRLVCVSLDPSERQHWVCRHCGARGTEAAPRRLPLSLTLAIAAVIGNLIGTILTRLL